jgi:hypothetical protein
MTEILLFLILLAIAPWIAVLAVLAFVITFVYRALR